MVARALWHLKPPENNCVKTRDNRDRDTMVLQKTRWQEAKLLKRCCYPVSSGRTGCGAGWCRQAPNTAQTPSHPRTVSHHHQTNTTSLSLLSADDCRPHHNNGLNRIGNQMGNFNQYTDYHHDRLGILHSYEGQILNTHQSCSQARRGAAGV